MPLLREASPFFEPCEGLRKTPPCRVLRSFEPAFAGWVPPSVIRLGSSLSRHAEKIGTPIKSVGSKPISSNTRTAGQLSYTTKKT